MERFLRKPDWKGNFVQVAYGLPGNNLLNHFRQELIIRTFCINLKASWKAYAVKCGVAGQKPERETNQDFFES